MEIAINCLVPVSRVSEAGVTFFPGFLHLNCRFPRLWFITMHERFLSAVFLTGGVIVTLLYTCGQMGATVLTPPARGGPDNETL